MISWEGFLLSAEMSADNDRFLDQLVQAGTYASRVQAIDEAVTLLRLLKSC
jgi:Arc/MetJ-type ribon-helix-helix transcriptional regulator